MKQINYLIAISLIAGFLAACAAQPTSTPTPVPPAPTSQSSHDMVNMNAPLDAQFMDGMIVHHQGAIAMAKDALNKAERPEIKSLAQAILKAQDAEITQMQGWRKQWYPDLKDTSGMMMDAGPMAVKDGAEPYDIRFIDAMIPHHQSAIVMANEALQKAEKPEIKQLAEAIIKAQTAEIEQMKQWRAAWVK